MFQSHEYIFERDQNYADEAKAFRETSQILFRKSI